MASSEREWPLGVAILLVCLLFFLSLATVSKETVRKSSAIEGQWIEEQFGHSTLTRINAIADGWYLKSFDRLDKNSLRDWMSEDPAQRKREERLAEQNNVVLTWAKERKLTLLELGFWVLRRIALFKVLIPLWLPLGLLAVFHGWNERAIKQMDFGYTSPVVNHWARSGMTLITVVTILLFFAPVTIPPAVFPMLMAFWSVGAMLAIANIQKRI